MSRATKIDPQVWYTLQDVVHKKMFPWLPSYWSVRQAVLQKTNHRLLRPVTKGEGKNVRYQFKGENLIKFIIAVENGSVKL